MVTPAIHLRGECAEALALYEKAFDATDRFVRRYADNPDPSGVRPEQLDWVLHSGLTICGSLVNFSDADAPVRQGDNICLNVTMPNAQAVEKAYAVLMQGGQAAVALGPQFFSPLYAAVVDKFGVRWQIMC